MGKEPLCAHLTRPSSGTAYASRRPSHRLPVLEQPQPAYSARRVQQIVKEIAEKAKIKKRIYPHLLRYSVATTLLDRGMPIEQIQKFLGHSKLETTQVYAESTTEMIKESYRKALAE